MPDSDEQRDQTPLGLSPLSRELIISGLVVVAAFRLLWPKGGIDIIFLALLGAAAFLMLFDVESVEWLGIRARRRSIEEATEQVEGTTIPVGRINPPPVPTADSLRANSSSPAHAETGDEDAEMDKVPEHPLERLLWAYESIRIELLIIAGSNGTLSRRVDWQRYQMREIIDAAMATDLLPSAIADAIDQVRATRNEAVHRFGRSAVVKPASKLAVEILEKLKTIRLTYTRVGISDLALYTDESLQVERSERGIMLAQIGDDGEDLGVLIGVRSAEYITGRFVSWEWNIGDGLVGPAWYREPKTKKAVQAFHHAPTFVGREYPVEWHVERRIRRDTPELTSLIST